MHCDLISKGYLHVPSFISKERANSLFQQLKIDSKEFTIGDKQSPLSPREYKYGPAEDFLKNSIEELSSLADHSLVPTYSYCRLYVNGDELPPHIDRIACEISVSVVLNKDHDWPIYIEDSSGNPQEIELEVGDALIFSGVFNTHWREKFKGQNYSAFFLHYVREDGYNSDLEGDQPLIKDGTHESRVRKKIFKNELKSIGWKCPPDTENTYVTEYDLRDYIMVYDDIVNPKLCDHIIKTYENHSAWKPALTAGDTDNEKSDKRRCEVLEISREKDSESKIIDKDLFNAFGDAMKRYMRTHEHIEVTNDEGYFLLKYEKGGSYIQHPDDGKHNHRMLSAVMVVSDHQDYEGGDLVFFNSSYKPKLKKGSIVVFPSSFVFPHRVAEVTKGIRYSIVSWFK